jgi:hypothetical protein
VLAFLAFIDCSRCWPQQCAAPFLALCTHRALKGHLQVFPLDHPVPCPSAQFLLLADCVIVVLRSMPMLCMRLRRTPMLCMSRPCYCAWHPLCSCCHGVAAGPLYVLILFPAPHIAAFIQLAHCVSLPLCPARHIWRWSPHYALVQSWLELVHSYMNLCTHESSNTSLHAGFGARHVLACMAKVRHT